MSPILRLDPPLPSWAALRAGARQRRLGSYPVRFLPGPVAEGGLPSPFAGLVQEAAGFGAVDAARTAVAVTMLTRPELFGLPLTVPVAVEAPWALLAVRPAWRCLVRYDPKVCPDRPPGIPTVVLYVLREALSCDVVGTTWSFVFPHRRSAPDVASARRSRPVVPR